MDYHCAKLCLIILLFAVTAQPEKTTPEQLALPSVSCSVGRIRAVFGPQVKSNIHVKDITGAIIPLSQTEEYCGVRLVREKNQNLYVYSTYDSCYAQIEGSKVVIPLQVQLTGGDRWFRVNIICPLIKRRSEKTELIPTPLPGNCDTEKALRVDCGYQRISSDVCYKLGCCYDADDLNCYYRLNACSLDGHFVFSVKATGTDQPIDPSSLIVKDQPQCSPVVTTPDTAIFKIGVMDCGVKMKVEGDMEIYEVEVEELHTKKSITRHTPFSVKVQCEYEASKQTSERASKRRVPDLRSLYAVTNPPPVVAMGTMALQMRIAKDASFTSFFSEDQLPLTLPLRDVAYVEISFAQPSPDPTLSLGVRDCFAYPSSRHSVWTLLYYGCPNPLDNMRSSVPVDNQGKTTSHSQVRRFDVKTFAFLDPDTDHPSVEEIYFFCWVEICTDDVDCAQQCAIITSEEGQRRRREAITESDQVQLVSLGPLVLGRNSTELEDNPCVKQKTMFQVTVYVLSGVGAALLLILLFTVGLSFRKRQKPEAKQVCEVQVDSKQSQ
ncbi:zona pellucida sperm-binding protein 4-like [Sander lucioperca]|uniref:Zona pellucida sperm-binding protein 4-like n=1 Tax=Sander lucioperca TaxID=283035 RepID=A0A8D0A457_SANLU|nr:zona pellucida sperm-binding protein 4-like [Sander lucioperca]